MRVIRHILHTHGGWFAWACALALAVRLLVPVGYMPTRIGGAPAFELCPDAAPPAMAAMPSGSMGRMHHDHDKRGSTCPFAIAAMASVTGADAIVLMAPLVAPFAIGHILSQPSPRLRTARLRPPAQGPPAV